MKPDAAIGLLVDWLERADITLPRCHKELAELDGAGDATPEHLLLAALHEAGHVIAADAIGHRVVRARVLANGGGDVSSEPAEDDAFKKAILYLAGPCAELRYGVDWCRQYALGRSSDVLVAKESLVRWLNGEPECARSRIVFARAAYSTVESHWRQIMWLAVDLLRADENGLTGAEIAALCARPQFT